MTFIFRNAGPSGHGAGRMRYYVDLDGGDCIGSVEGKTGDFRLDSDYVTEGVDKATVVSHAHGGCPCPRRWRGQGGASRQ